MTDFDNENLNNDVKKMNTEEPLQDFIAEPEENRPHWMLWQVLICFVLIFLITNLSVFALAQTNISYDISLLLASFLQELSTLALPVLVVAVFYHHDAASLGFRRIENGNIIPKAIFFGIVYYILSTVTLLIILLIYPFDINIQNSVQPILMADTLLQKFIWVIFSVVIAPFSEEVFFRGFLYTSLRNKMPYLPAALLGGFFFGLVHFDLPRFIPIALLGFLLCRFYEKYKNIYLNTIIHMAFNGFSLLLLFFNKTI